MRVPVYIWQFNQDYPGSNPNDNQLPMSEAWVKTHDGVTWMGDIYAHPLAPKSASDVAKLAHDYTRGNSPSIGFVPWCVPTGRNIPVEAALAIQVLDALSLAAQPLRLVVDLEYDSTQYFWKGTPAQMVQYVGLIKQAHPTAELTLVHYQSASIGLSSIAPHFDVLSTMDYWNDFGTTPVAQLASSQLRCRPYGKPIVYGLPGNAPSSELATALAWVEANGGRCVVWRRGTTTGSNWATIAGVGPSVYPITPTAPYLIGPGFADAINRDHTLGLPLRDTAYDPAGNGSVYTSATPTHPHGSTLLWNKGLNRVIAVSW